jgi:hypothetical protein
MHFYKPTEPEILDDYFNLDLNLFATVLDVKKASRIRALLYHPDKKAPCKTIHVTRKCVGNGKSTIEILPSMRAKKSKNVSRRRRSERTYWRRSNDLQKRNNAKQRKKPAPKRGVLPD